MHDFMQNMVSEYSLTDLSELEELLKELKQKKKKELETSPALIRFNHEYEIYIKNTFSDKYLVSVHCSFKHMINYFGETKNIGEINQKEVEDFKHYLIEKAPKGYTVYLRTIKASFSVAIEWGYISSNPFQKIKFQKRQSFKPIFLRKKELDKILAHMRSPIMYNIIVFGFYTGCRLNEIVNLKWGNIDLNKKVILIGDDEFRTKSGKQRIIPMNRTVKNMLTKLRQDLTIAEGYAFTKSNGFRFNGDYVSSCFKTACKKAEMDNRIHFHTLRHSFASNLANKGVPIVVIKELMGHSDISTTQIYSHTNLESLKAAISKFDIGDED